MEKYPKIKHLGSTETKGIFDNPNDKIIIQEKIDGANFRFMKKGDKIIYGSRNVKDVTKDNWKIPIDYLDNKLNPNKLDEDLIYIGEAMKKHSLSYPFDELPEFIGFEVLHKDTGMPLNYEIAKEEFENLDLKYAKVLFEGEIKNLSDEDLANFLQESNYRDGAPEGIVIKNYSRLNQYGRPLFAKKVTKKFKEKNKAVFGEKKVKKGNTELIVEQYATEGRIRKMIYKLVNNQGYNMDRSLMEVLYPRVIEDILKEEILDIYNDKNIERIDFGLMHKLIPTKCIEILDMVLEEEVSA